MRKAPLLVLPLLLAMATAPVGATATTLQPGDLLESSVGLCTLNFVYDGIGVNAGKVYLGTAAHCVDRVGEEVDSPPYEGFGTVAFIGDPDTFAHDYAFIEVKPAFLMHVRPFVKGHAGFPTGVSSHLDTQAGERLQFSGYGMGFEFSGVTQERRVGVLNSDNANTYVATGITNFGDSGGPIVHVPTGRALGIISQVCLGACTDRGPTVEGILAKAAAAGFPVTLRTV